MKKIIKAIASVFGFAYILFIIFVTVCLLNYNDYKVTEIKDKTFILIDDKSDKFNDGDLVVFTKNNNDDIKENDEISFYEVTSGKSTVNIGKVTNTEKVNDKETTFTINGNHKISSETVIGKVATAKIFPKLGKVLYVFESQYGFLLLVIFPSIMIFFYAVYSFIKELKTSTYDDEEEENDEIEETEEEPSPIKTNNQEEKVMLKPRDKKEAPIALKNTESDKKNDLWKKA